MEEQRTHLFDCKPTANPNCRAV